MTGKSEIGKQWQIMIVALSAQSISVGLWLALIGDRFESNAVLVLALVLCRALQPVDKGGLFDVKQARKCERGV